MTVSLRPPGRLPHLPTSNQEKSMRAEIQAIVDEIEQAIALLRRHL
jgi:hypothetical protein